MNIFENLEKQIIEEANKTPVAECCGLVEIENFKFNIPIFKIIPFKNNAVFSANNFEMNPYKFLSLTKTKKIYALYHSHLYTGDSDKDTEIFSEADINLSESYKIPLILYSVDKERFNWYKPFSLEFEYKNRSFLIGVRDCYSLVRDFYNKELGIRLGDFYRNTKEPKETIIKNLGFYEVNKKEIKKNDIILLNDNGIYADLTITIYMGQDRILGHFDTTSSYRPLSNNVNNIYKVLRYGKFN